MGYALFDTMKSYFHDKIFHRNTIIESLSKKEREKNERVKRRNKERNERIKRRNKEKNERIKRRREEKRCKREKDQINKLNIKNDTLNKMVIQLIDFKNKCIAANNRLISKNNALLDTTQFFNDQLYGKRNDSTSGYVKSLVTSQKQKDNLLDQKIGEIAKQQEGFNMFNKLDDENTVIKNQLTINKNEHSVDDQKYIYLNNQVEFLNSANKILGWVLFAVVVICALVIWGSKESLTHKLIMIKVVWLYLIFVEILEYVLFYVYRYFNALFFGQPYNANDYWKFPHLSWLDIGIIILIALSFFI